MKPLILGMAPASEYPVDSWHPLSPSTANLAYLCFGAVSEWRLLEELFDTSNLNNSRHVDVSGRDTVEKNEANKKLTVLVDKGFLRSGRPVVALGRKVTSLVNDFFQPREPIVLKDYQGNSYPITLDNSNPNTKFTSGWDFVLRPTWHPSNLTRQKCWLPLGWEQRAMDTLREAARLSPMKYQKPSAGSLKLSLRDLTRRDREKYFDLFQMQRDDMDGGCIVSRQSVVSMLEGLD